MIFILIVRWKIPVSKLSKNFKLRIKKWIQAPVLKRKSRKSFRDTITKWITFWKIGLRKNHLICHVYKADIPERASVLNMNKFNGKFGCIMCMQQVENLIDNGRGNNFKYTFKPNEMFIRTEQQRLRQQVKESIFYYY
jgi:hypothetical protein